MELSRRSFLAVTAAAGLSHVSFAAEPTGADTLVVVFLRGGCDALSLVAPVNDPDYVADRPPELRVLPDGAKPGRALRHSVDPAIDFRLHPDAAALGDLYDQGQLAVIHAVGLTNGTRSHFAAQAMMDHGIAEEAEMTSVPSGWLTRLVQGRAIGTGNSLPDSLLEQSDALAIPDLSGGLGLAGGTPKGALPARDALAALYQLGNDPFSRASRGLLADLQDIDRRLPRGPDGKLLPYQPEAKGNYDGSQVGRGLATVARLIKLDLGLQAAAVDMGGWDHHEGMQYRFPACASQLASNLSVFWNDVSRYHPRLTVVVMSEFGRRVRANKSSGTDHGHGGVMFALGGGVRGGAILGTWPGLSAERLDNAADLAVTTDYRQILSEIMVSRLGAGDRVARVFPRFSSGPRLGLV